MARKQIIMEFPIKASPALLFNYISTPSGLSQWFCVDVDIRNNLFKFKWEGEELSADLIKKVNNKSMKFKWTNSEKDEYLEFDINVDELTDDVALIITDYAEESEEKYTYQLWESQIHDLKSCIGA
ncbi:MAG: SRPBCC domain-containing protein [Bacteroidia bacterium]|nr:SRPBCC domain-containing protein [Bacteroidia bacterium]